jgi:hypothetical protein
MQSWRWLPNSVPTFLIEFSNCAGTEIVGRPILVADNNRRAKIHPFDIETPDGRTRSEISAWFFATNGRLLAGKVCNCSYGECRHLAARSSYHSGIGIACVSPPSPASGSPLRHKQRTRIVLRLASGTIALPIFNLAQALCEPKSKPDCAGRKRHSAC